MKAAPEPVVAIIRPQLTPDEFECRLEKLKESVVKFWLEIERSGANEKRKAET